MTILKRPIITEKSMSKSREGEYAFEVEISANKNQIKKEVEDFFKVTVLSVKTMTMKGKTKRAGRMRKETKASDWKKAIVVLAKDQTIDIFPTA